MVNRERLKWLERNGNLRLSKKRNKEFCAALYGDDLMDLIAAHWGDTEEEAVEGLHDTLKIRLAMTCEEIEDGIK